MSQHHRFGVDLATATIEEAIAAAIVESGVVEAWYQAQNVHGVFGSSLALHADPESEPKEEAFMAKAQQALSKEDFRVVHAIAYQWFRHCEEYPLPLLTDDLGISREKLIQQCHRLVHRGFLQMVKRTTVTREGVRIGGLCWFAFPNVEGNLPATTGDAHGLG